MTSEQTSLSCDAFGPKCNVLAMFKTATYGQATENRPACYFGRGLPCHLLGHPLLGMAEGGHDLRWRPGLDSNKT